MISLESYGRRFALLTGLISFGLVIDRSAAAPLDLSDTPLFLTVNIPPNLILTLDDSGSMSRAFTPDLCGNPNGICDDNPDSSLDHRYVKSSHYNPIYYDPTKTYNPPLDADGNPLITSFTSAYINGFDAAYGTVNLSTNYRPSAGLWLHSSSDRSHQFMRHYPGDIPGHVDIGTTTNTSPPTFTISDYTAPGGSGNATDNIVSVKVNGTAATNVGTFTGSCATSNDPGSNYQYKTKVSGSTVTFCFRDSSTMKNKSIEVIHSQPTGAYYYVFDAANANCDGTATDNDCYDIKFVSATSGPGGTDERQNFANWYSFFRTRNLMTVTTASRAMANVPPSFRVAWQALNSCRGSPSNLVTSDCEGWETTASNFGNAINNFSGTHKTNFYNWLFRLKTYTSTPLRQAMERAGNYYKTSGDGSPYDNDFGAASSAQYACRKNYHVVMTDGIWNDSVSDYGNKDASSATLPDGTSYSPTNPYSDSNSNSLADIAFAFWSTDLRPDLTNNIIPTYLDRSGTASDQYKNPKNDPASWQHMVNYTVGLGLSTFLNNSGLTWGGDTFSGSYSALASGSQNWPVAAAGLDGNAADLWHAAINSRGKFFNVERPDDMENAFNAILTSIADTTSSSAALAANSTGIQTGTVLYQARFNTQDWHGQLIAYPVQGDGSIGIPYWDASTKIPAAGDRNIVTWDGSTGIGFTDCDTLSASQKAALDTNANGVVDNKCADRLAWLRGDSSKEQRFANGIFRNRMVSVLGDIIDSDPAFVKDEDYGYGEATSALAEKSSYASFVSGKSSRTPVVYVGANDGMLHAFRADTGSADSGKELFAYIPAGVYDTLSKLTEPAYAHKYFVDGAPTAGDAYLSGEWKTVLVGGLGAGGKSIYALDISDPNGFDADNVLWEFSDSADLGYTFSQPQIARLSNGQWAAIFGNGYNSASDKAFLYVVNLSNGSQIAKIAAGDSTSNGLSTPVLYDANNDKIIDYAYAGDLQGNLWKFDLSALTLANGGNPLFTATNASGQVQPITVQPVIGEHPNGGVLIYFGTGRYLTSTDPSNDEVQSFYAIWDKPGETGTVPRDDDHIQAQTITAETVQFSFGQRETSNNTVDWGSKRGWYLDLVPPSGAAGERVISRALLRYERIIFVTLIPSTDPCVAGGDSWLMELDAVTGGRSSISNFDFNGDNVFDDADKLASGNVSSGIKSTVGITETPTWLQSETPGVAYKELSGTTGNIMSIKNRGPSDDEGGGSGTIERKYWMQIQ